MAGFKTTFHRYYTLPQVEEIQTTTYSSSDGIALTFSIVLVYIPSSFTF
jgi:hypothetical protein